MEQATTKQNRAIKRAIAKHGLTQLVWHSDPQHGWLQVPKKLVPPSARLMFSHYSYEDKENLYLEEDCDAPKFKAILAEIWLHPNKKEIFYEEYCPIRDKRDLKHPAPRKKSLQTRIREHIESHFTIIPVTV